MFVAESPPALIKDPATYSLLSLTTMCDTEPCVLIGCSNLASQFSSPVPPSAAEVISPCASSNTPPQRFARCVKIMVLQDDLFRCPSQYGIHQTLRSCHPVEGTRNQALRNFILNQAMRRRWQIRERNPTGKVCRAQNLISLTSFADETQLIPV